MDRLLACLEKKDKMNPFQLFSYSSEIRSDFRVSFSQFPPCPFVQSKISYSNRAIYAEQVDLTIDSHKQLL